MPIETQKLSLPQLDRVISEMFNVLSGVYWPQYFDQWTILLIEHGFSQEEVYTATDDARKKVREKAKSKQRVERSDIISLARLIVRFYEIKPPKAAEKYF